MIKLSRRGDCLFKLASIATIFVIAPGRITLHPQLSHVILLIPLCNLTMTSCYVNTRYDITSLYSLSTIQGKSLYLVYHKS